MIALLGCSDAYQVTVRFEDPARRAQAAQIEVSVIEACGGVDPAGPPSSPFRTVVVRPGETADALGELATGTYGLSARAVNDACTVIAAGCSSITITAGETGQLVVTLSNVEESSCASSLCPGICSGGDGSVDANEIRDVGIRDVGIRDVGLDVEPDAGFDGGPGCEAPGLQCGDMCINAEADLMHCGTCDNACGESDLCFEGTCEPQDVCTDALGVPCGQVFDAYFKASDPDYDNEFGVAVSASGDTLAVAAPDAGSNEDGVVYVFRRVDDLWTQEAYLEGSETADFSHFGRALSLSGDTLAVGADASEREGDLGAVHVFQRTGSSWVEEARLVASNAAENDGFGSTVSLSGNMLATSSPSEDSSATGVGGDQGDNSASGSGAVYVFERIGDTWTEQAYIKASNTDAGDAFGRSLALSGNTLAVGASGEGSRASGVDGNQTDNAATSSGAVYVFTLNDGTWRQQAYLKGSTVERGDAFGYSLCLDGDTLAIGAFSEDSAAVGVDGDQTDNSAPSSGAVFVFERAGGVWGQRAYLKPSATDGLDWFGHSLSLSGNHLAVGARGEDSAATGVNGDPRNNTSAASGAVYLFRRTRGLWNLQAYLKPPGTAGADLFGGAVFLNGNTLLVGASGEDSAAAGVNGDRGDNSIEESGAAYMFRVGL